ncbi:hypothetical protein CEY16_13510 [Halalkalibacillus sediminis]|uniref:SecDF P1 head subdomain domain-containing protein n=1 Tax=Halalkalibacillus sediminis TaxID=2018042 RepID=A0A2I0QR77_9BACI|nr:hypothetical protein [Halalkalibacillus sediminis]PKR76828.1 hypothetical protein CEY16_13510 [Halalkalibacillus sediminis]
MIKNVFILIGLASLLMMAACDDSESISASGEEELYIATEDGEKLATEEDFERTSVEQIERDGESIVTISIEFRRADKLYRMTSDHIGEVTHVYYGDKIISSPKVHDTIESKSVMIEGDFTKEEAEIIVESVNG